ncbi:ejaculatory bulb-specific protein 3-like [Lycorma delicatula]|uniref:ejaculatory bulb-specific protein 3-like n=1 Tax=Lycorma delicatula TaxID=130591 RepID=UPI003F5130FC
MMNRNYSVVFFALSLLILCLSITCRAADQYTTKYDNIDIDKILGNERVLTQYFKCLMGEGACTNEGRELKRLLPDAIETGCSKCNPKQRSAAKKVMLHMKSKRSQQWDRLINKYDPKSVHRQRLQEFLNEKLSH